MPTAPVDPWPHAPMIDDRFEPARRVLARPKGTPVTMYPPPATPKRRRIWPLVLLALALLLLCSGALTAVVTASAGSNSSTPGFGEIVTTPEPTSNPVGTPSSWRLKSGDLQLTVDVRDKECFGTAGCNVEFRLAGGVTDTVRAKLAKGDRSYEVRYEVRGFTSGKQVGTLEIAPDGSFVQDGFQFGQTASGGAKLKVKVTGVEQL